MTDLYALFHSHFGAIDFEKKFKDQLVGFKLQPTPRSLSSSCGICAAFSLGEGMRLTDLLTEHVSEIYKKEDTEFIVLYEQEVS